MVQDDAISMGCWVGSDGVVGGSKVCQGETEP